ncbi:LAME_0H07404g1_1 [Lachancea meyersii CBS 8951]|uniref:LAME_0H07404g1_1 n=1 Tax=Lachancea meyersii CBS 8951 TaxID=1266667 RepID=A0A1G4KF07_9SACH|nr:LAME_0H07404g1_1 [Lachancea meyersii CBS 8951]
MASKTIERDEESSITRDLLDSDDEADELSKDWSHIAKLCKSQAVVPKRGDKDYEPDGTNAQELLLYRAKKAMFDSLSDAARGTVVKNQIKAFYVPERHLAFISQPKGNFMHTMGKVDRNGTCWLNFHEFVYLAERGTITPYFKRSDREDHGLDPLLSIQDLYLLFRSSQESDEFAVFAHLKRLGFIVMPSQMSPDDHNNDQIKHMPRAGLTDSLSKLTKALSQIFQVPTYHPLQYHLTRYTTSGQIYAALNKLVPFYTAPKTAKEIDQERYSRTINSRKNDFTFDVWKPQGSFKKKTPGLPDLHILVLNKNTSDYSFPTYSVIRSLFQSVYSKYDGTLERQESAAGSPLSSKTGKQFSKPVPPHLEQQRRLKKGYRSFILAVMDDGLISFVKLTESDFGSENVWFKTTRRASKNKPRSDRSTRHNGGKNPGGEKKTEELNAIR